MTASGRADDLRLAHHLADVAASIALRHFAPSVEARLKLDGTPVTAADLEVDRELVRILEQERPGDAVLSEESGAHGYAPRRWIIDPIDGTVPFARGGAGWATFVALEEHGDLTLGVINRPVDGQRYSATEGAGTRASATERGLVVGPERTPRVSSVAKLDDVRFTAIPPIDTPALATLRSVCTWVEPTYDFMIDLVEGRIDVLLSQGGEVWDHAAEVIILEEADGRFHDPLGGRRLDLHGGTYTNGAVDAAIGSLLQRF